MSPKEREEISKERARTKDADARVR